MQIGKIDAAKRLILDGHRLRIVHRRGDELVEVDVLEVESLAHVRADRAQQPSHLFLIAGAVELRLHRVRRRRDLTERKRRCEDFDQDGFHRDGLGPALEFSTACPLESVRSKSSSLSFKTKSISAGIGGGGFRSAAIGGPIETREGTLT